VDSVLSHLEAVKVSEEMEKDILNGRPVLLDGIVSAAGNSCRAYASGGKFIAVLRFAPDKGHWRPQKVFR
jgi:tRNA U55 pseudouridine synthase TruB